MNKLKISSQYFKKLFIQEPDDQVFELNDAPGITIIRKYPTSDIEKRDFSMFIRFYIEDGFVRGGVSIITNKDGLRVDEDESNFTKKVMNFYLDPSDKITFDANKNNIILKRGKKIHHFTLNNFIELLIKNHLYNKLFFERIIEKAKIKFLEGLFWIADDKYTWINYYLSMKADTNHLEETPEIIGNIIEPDPFFKYFKIFRNLLFIFISIVSILLSIFYLSFLISCDSYGIMRIFESAYFSIANPFFVFWFFVFLFILEMITKKLQSDKVNKTGYIYKIHNSLLQRTFTLKLYKSSKK